ncbi:MAG: biotin/lipoyl-binding protein [Deltaproteobacteria bacterium]|nr:biotin/lipoyl-binding protein [Deltaproteobacteria bacterium]
MQLRLPLKISKKKPAGPPPMLVEVAPIAEGDAEALVERVGTVRYARVSRVATEVSGIVEELFFTEGTRVKAGQSMR